MSEKTCPICGKPTNVYMGKARKDGLCREHGMQANRGDIIQCFLCNKWHDADEDCKCTKAGKEQAKTQKPEKFEISENIIIDKGIRCITCGYETEGKLFCKKCYAKYSGKEILIKIKNCREIVPLDDFYEGYFECDDGHVVKSMAERDIDDYLFANNIKHGYEIPIPITDSNGKKVILHPDFCIFDEHSNPLYYIEYWGYDDNNRDYTKTKKYKIPLYEKAGITLININGKSDLRNLKMNLKHKLKTFEMGKINFLVE